jgi:hypothetical protein
MAMRAKTAMDGLTILEVARVLRRVEPRAALTEAQIRYLVVGLRAFEPAHPSLGRGDALLFDVWDIALLRLLIQIRKEYSLQRAWAALAYLHEDLRRGFYDHVATPALIFDGPRGYVVPVNDVRKLPPPPSGVVRKRFNLWDALGGVAEGYKAEIKRRESEDRRISRWTTPERAGAHVV